MQHKPTYLILDIGNVLVSVYMENIYKQIIECKFAADVEDAQKFMKNIEGIVNMGLIDLAGAIDLNFGWQAYSPTYGGKSYFEQRRQKLIDFWCSENCARPNIKTLEFLEELLKREFNLKIILASNIGSDHYAHIKSLHKFFRDAPNVSHFCSSEQGVIKPKYSFFKLLKEKNGFLSETFCENDCLYIDDKEENIMEGKNHFAAFQYDCAKQNENVFIDIVADFVENRDDGYFHGWE